MTRARHPRGRVGEIWGDKLEAIWGIWGDQCGSPSIAFARLSPHISLVVVDEKGAALTLCWRGPERKYYYSERVGLLARAAAVAGVEAQE